MSDTHKCQIHCVSIMSERNIKIDMSLYFRLRLLLRKHLKPSMKRRIKRYLTNLTSLPSRLSRRDNLSSKTIVKTESRNLKSGDLVRIRPKEEIEATLDRWGSYKGCAFMSGMQQYCDTIQRVLKPVERFVDERDYHVKQSRNIVILEGIICQGTPFYGSCDRSCYFFWRNEWLEKIEDAKGTETPS